MSSVLVQKDVNLPAEKKLYLPTLPDAQLHITEE